MSNANNLQKEINKYFFNGVWIDNKFLSSTDNGIITITNILKTFLFMFKYIFNIDAYCYKMWQHFQIFKRNAVELWK